jgi:hypothetical protein
MKSVVALEINAPRERVAALLADPRNTTKWMDDLEKYEAISGPPGTPGSKYRLVPKTGESFVATLLPTGGSDAMRLSLDAPTAVVSVTDEFLASSSETTKLISMEVFRFKGTVQKLKGLFARRAISNAHRRHMRAFKWFAEHSSSG